MSTPPNNQTGMPGHGPLPRAADLSGGRTDPRNSGISGQDRDLLGADATMLSGQAGTGYASSRPQSEFSAFLEDLSQLVRSQNSQSEQSGGGTDLRAEVERRIGQARERMSGAVSGALGQAQEAGAVVGERVQRGLDQSRGMVADRPLQAILAAALGGLVVGLLLSAGGHDDD